MKEAIQFIYNNSEVDFLPTGNDNLMVNATQMANIFEKRVDVFLKTDHAQAFIEALLRVPKSVDNKKLSTPNGGDNFKYSADEILKTNKRGGTWMHRILALKFAAWLNPDFEVWVFETADKILLGHYRELKEATIEKLQAEKDLADKKEELIKNHPDLAEIFELELKITAADRKRLKALKASVAQLKLDFFPETV